jgi:hypothetical protein
LIEGEGYIEWRSLSPVIEPFVEVPVIPAIEPESHDET